MKRLKLFVFIVFIQIIILNNIQFSGYINPYYYIIFILTIPNKSNKSLILLLSFFTGITIDIFSSTYGAHAFACVLISYLKILWGNRFSKKQTEEEVDIQNLSFQKFLTISTILISIHHFTLFTLEKFSFVHIGEILATTILTTIIIYSS